MSDEATELALQAERDERDEALSSCVECGCPLGDGEHLLCLVCWNELPLGSWDGLSA